MEELVSLYCVDACNLYCVIKSFVYDLYIKLFLNKNSNIIRKYLVGQSFKELSTLSDEYIPCEL